MKVIIYTDGSARSNPGRGGYGAVLKYTNPAGKTFTSELSRGYAKTTNNRHGAHGGHRGARGT